MSDNTPTNPETPLPRKAATNGRKATTWQEVVKTALPYVGAVALVVALALFALKSGTKVDATLIGAIVAGAIAVLSLILTRQANGGTGAAGAAGVLLLSAASLLTPGCAGLDVPDGYRCDVERTSVAMVGAAIDVADRELPASAEGRDEALEGARGGLRLGEAAVAACDTVAADDDAPAWRAWLKVAVTGLRGVVAIMTACAVPVPDFIDTILSSLATMFATATAGGVG